jgi:hypothetical protein
MSDYKTYLCALMSWKDETHYSNDTSFSREELNSITPNDIYRYFKYIAYGDADCDEKVATPMKRAESLKYYKKAISQSLPDPTLPWNDVAMLGNPTKSNRVNKLISTIRKKEVAGLGVPSQARRALDATEFESLMEVIENERNEENRVFLSAYFKFQYNMIARVDDTAKFRLEHLKGFQQFPDFGVIARLCWSKNVMEERDAPDQILIGASDHRYCPLIGLGGWLEFHFAKHPMANEFVFGIHGLSNPNSIKQHASNQLNKIFNNDEFKASDFKSKKIGTHSLRKFTTTVARSSGCNKDDTDYRARWKGQKRQQDSYANVTIPYIDAKVAAALCKGGACAYRIVQGVDISNDWILDHVVPHIRDNCDRAVAIVLGKALMWKIFSEYGSCVPQDIRNRVLNAYKDVVVHSPNINNNNPIEKVILVVDGEDAQLVMDVLFDGDENETDTETTHRSPRVSGRNVNQQEIRFLRSQIMHLREENRELKIELERRDKKLERQLNFLNRNVQRIANAPGRRHITQGGISTPQSLEIQNAEENRVEEEQGRLTAVLGKHPRSLHDLWNEYEFGSPGHKPAKDFTPKERGGNNKHRFYLRRFLWNKVAEMVRSGMDARTACDKIYDAYGHNQSVSNILKRLQADSKTGDHPNLRINQI